MDVQKLAKVLAMAASDNDAEALHALRTAKRLLEAGGSDFVALAGRLGDGSELEVWKDAVFDLRNEVRQVRAENEKLRQARLPAAAPSFQDSARDAADLIRLRAEIDAVRADMARVRNHEASIQDQYRQALAESERLSLRLSEIESRRMRLEAENRRLSVANHALNVDLAEARAQIQDAAAASLSIASERPKIKAPTRASDKSRGQYALF